MLGSCTLEGDGTAVEVSREVPPFTALEVFDGFEVEVQVDEGLAATEAVALAVTAEANVIDRVFTEVHGEDVLSIAVNPNLRTELTQAPQVRMTVPGLEGVFASDRAIVRVAGAGGALAIEGESAAVIEMSALADVEAIVIARGTSAVSLAGTARRVTIAVREGATVDGSRLAAEAVEVRVEGPTATAAVCTTGAAPAITGEAAQVTVGCAR